MAALALLLTACSSAVPPEEAGCRKDSDCGDGFGCREGRCLTECATTAECPLVAATCVDGLCEVPCEVGACDSNAGQPCWLGGYDCLAEAPTCIDREPAEAGTVCGASDLCDGEGNCVPCVAGAVCSTNPGAPCVVGAQVCSPTPGCVDGSTFANAGVSCGTGEVCDGNGSCGACDAGQSCTTNPGAPCRLGVIDCGTGSEVCVDGAAASGSCGTNLICVDGDCVACTSGADCDADANPCTHDTMSCGGASPGCGFSNNVGNGTSCGAGLACNGSGACQCAAGGSCNDGNACTSNDIYTCPSGPTGAAVCAGTSIVGTGCNDSNSCTTGDVWSCPGGTPVCSGVGSGTGVGACDDGNPCTSNDWRDTCGGACVGTPSSGGPGSCSDADYCTQNDYCDNGTCVSGTSMVGTSCNDGQACSYNDVVTACGGYGPWCSGTSYSCPGQTCDGNGGCY